MKFTMMKPATLLAVCLGQWGLTVQAQPADGLAEWAGDARAVLTGVLVCDAPASNETCARDDVCDCFCDAGAEVICNGGANCPDLMECLTQCRCDISS